MLRSSTPILIGADARGVTVLTCHALAMRIAGISFETRFQDPDDSTFKAILRRAVAILEGTDQISANPGDPENTDKQDDPDDLGSERRARILAGFRWILVDEYQDLRQDEYDLISALAGRTLADPDAKLSLFAVGDDDQNIYDFSGASATHLRRFHDDYGAAPAYLIANYRSTAHIIAAANTLIEPASGRMKAEHAIRIDPARRDNPPGGAWRHLDATGAQGRIQVLRTGNTSPATQGRLAVDELLRLSRLDPDWNWSRTAVIARKWDDLDPVRAACEIAGIPVQSAGDLATENQFWRFRETQAFTAWLRARPSVATADIEAWFAARPANPWDRLLRQAVDEHAAESGTGDFPTRILVEWLAEWARDIRRRQHGVLLVTAHSAKGLEFDHVAILDGYWGSRNSSDDPDSGRRLYYVAMTRARASLSLLRWAHDHPIQDALRDHPAVLWRDPPEPPPDPPELRRRYIRPPPGDIDLGYASRLAPSSPAHQAIRDLAPGDPLTLRTMPNGRRHLLDRNGVTIGHLAHSFSAPNGLRCTAARVVAVLHRTRTITNPKYHETIRTDPWEVVVPDLVFDPAN